MKKYRPLQPYARKPYTTWILSVTAAVPVLIAVRILFTILGVLGELHILSFVNACTVPSEQWHFSLKTMRIVLKVKCHCSEGPVQSECSDWFRFALSLHL